MSIISKIKKRIDARLDRKFYNEVSKAAFDNFIRKCGDDGDFLHRILKLSDENTRNKMKKDSLSREVSELRYMMRNSGCSYKVCEPYVGGTEGYVDVCREETLGNNYGIVLIKRFSYDKDDAEDREFALREADELIETLKE